MITYTRVLDKDNRALYQQLHYIGVKLNKLEDANRKGATGRVYNLTQQIRQHKSNAVRLLRDAENI